MIVTGVFFNASFALTITPGVASTAAQLAAFAAIAAGAFGYVGAGYLADQLRQNDVDDRLDGDLQKLYLERGLTLRRQSAGARCAVHHLGRQYHRRLGAVLGAACGVGR